MSKYLNLLILLAFVLIFSFAFFETALGDWARDFFAKDFVVSLNKFSDFVSRLNSNR